MAPTAVSGRVLAATPPLVMSRCSTSTIVACPVTVPFRCHLGQAQALLKLKKSFSFDESTTTLPSWRDGTDCCLWEGVGCDASSGNVTVLNNRGLSSNGLDPAVFSLASLRRLDLSMNDFSQNWNDPLSLRPDNIPATGFERFALLTHLNLSNSGLSGQIPIGISKLVNLVSLDLSNSIHYHPHAVINLQGNDALTAGPFPEFFMDFLNLTVLQLSDTNLEGWFPSRSFQSKNLRVLDLSHNHDLGGHLPCLSNSNSLETLRIGMTNFSYAKPIWNNIPATGFERFPLLTHLNLSNSGLSGQIPIGISKLVNLLSLDLSSSIDYGPYDPPAYCSSENCNDLFEPNFDTLVANLSNLRELYLDGVDLSPSGEEWCISLATSVPRLHVLSLASCHLSGPIHKSLSRLHSLAILDLSRNSLNGEIPSSIFTLPVLCDLDLSWNHLSGPIREFDKAHSQLEYVDLSTNEFSGPIPKAFFQLTSLKHVDLSLNNLRGEISSSIFTLPVLRSLCLSGNQLSGPIREFDKAPSQLEYVDLSKNKFSGPIPKTFFQLTSLEDVDFSSNNLSGLVDLTSFWRLSSLTYLNLSHNMLTGIQFTSDVLPSTSLVSLDLSFNRLGGRIPMPNSSAAFLDYSNNRFSSVLPNWAFYLNSTKYLSMSKNSINGHIPTSICNSMLDILDLSHNNFSGSVPSCLIENGQLRVLNLRENHFEGMLPSNITTRCALQTIDLHGNKIEGQIPRGLSNCSQLEVLDLGSNRIADTFPSWLRGLSNLHVLALGSNQFYGAISDIVGDNRSEECFPSLQIIDLASNNFSGNLRSQWFERLEMMMSKFNSSGETLSSQNLTSPNGFYQDSIEITYKGSYISIERILTTLTVIDFSNNRLEGTIP
ncbi:receptor-like protein 6 [Phragmites australis]|uniref:receptor-like protein 6 n=1 Tax=Phragmites australis TaxID=29695 RepID=UPI002D76E4A3|nr:receptor-like protein 6 [Phragmites australis]